MIISIILIIMMIMIMMIIMIITINKMVMPRLQNRAASGVGCGERDGRPCPTATVGLARRD